MEIIQVARDIGAVAVATHSNVPSVIKTETDGLSIIREANAGDD